MDQSSELPAGAELRRQILESINPAKLRRAKRCDSPKHEFELVLSLVHNFMGSKPRLLSFGEKERIVSEVIYLTNCISLVLLTSDRERLSLLESQLEKSSHLSYIVLSHSDLSESGLIVAKIIHKVPDIILVDIDPKNSIPGIRTISLMKDLVGDVCIFAIGAMTNRSVIVGAMRSGATEFLDRENATQDLLKAFQRFLSKRRKGSKPDPEEASGSTPVGAHFLQPGERSRQRFRLLLLEAS